MGTQQDGDTGQGGRPLDQPSPEEILATGPSSKELDTALTKPPRRGGGLSSTAMLVVGVLLAVTFVGGLFVGRATAPEQTAAFPGAGNFPNGGNLPGATGAGDGAFPDGGGFTAGTVSRIDGDTIYVETADGQTIEVRTNGDTTVQVTNDGEVSDLAEGETVIVQGATADDGSLDATSITEGGGAGGFPGAPGGNG